MMQRLRNNPLIVFGITLLLVLGVGLLIFGSSSGGAVNPNGDEKLDPDEGKTYAAIYKHGELYKAVGEEDDALHSVREDLVLFARTTRPELSDPNVLVGFTVTKQLPKEGETSVFLGKYYGFSDDILLKVTPHGRGVYTLSITNQNDQTNIDEFLSMNGKRNRYITTLPIQKDRYSIRYQTTEDRIVVTFYDGYSNADIDAVVASLQEGLGDTYEQDVVFSINRVGIFPLSLVKENLVNPIEQ